LRCCAAPNHPDPLDELTHWAQSGTTTTKSDRQPPLGRALVGPVTVTAFLRAIRPADRFAISPRGHRKPDRPRRRLPGRLLSRSTKLLCAEVESRLTGAARPVPIRTRQPHVRAGSPSKPTNRPHRAGGRSAPHERRPLLEQAPATRSARGITRAAPIRECQRGRSAARLRASTATITPLACRRDYQSVEAEHPLSIDSPSCHSRER